ncbi:MAG: sulfotransferase domain-containing protein [Gammaproteobacteria bacterium]|nr:sulfotransferase domain-containing protein [Gammaproteobacteria bacterium]
MKNTLGLIATLPKSGTWYSHIFFWCYDQLIRNQAAYLKGEFHPDLIGILKNRQIQSVSTHPETLGIEQLFICHVICPGFYEIKDEKFADWNLLRFPLPYNGGEGYIRGFNQWENLNPKTNPQAKIVYLCRNPLDHFVSYFHNAMTSVEINHRNKTLADGTIVPLTSVQDFVFNFGALSGFIKHYYSFKQMQNQCPEQVKIISYERLTQIPDLVFGEILAFMGTPVDTEIKQRLFKDALALCSKESLMKIEASLNRSLVGNQLSSNKHIRDGKVGKWKDYFNDEEILKIEAAFNLFDISLKDFQLTSTEMSVLPDIDDTKQKYVFQVEFFKQVAHLYNLELQHEIIELKQELNEMLDSNSWRFTAPLRAMRKLTK